MKPLFADTSFYIALLDPRDVAHDFAVAWSERSFRVVSTEFVVMELGSFFSRRMHRRLFGQLFQRVQGDPGTKVVPASRVLVSAGARLFMEHEDKEWSLTDCTSFATMRQRRLEDALTVDHHFEQAGFRALLRHHPDAKPRRTAP